MACLVWTLLWSWLGPISGASGLTVAANRPPVIHFVRVTPKAPRTNAVLVAKVWATDPDGDHLTLHNHWLRNGKPLPGRTTRFLHLALPGNGNRGDRIRFKVVVGDGHVIRVRVTPPITILDSRPIAYRASVSATAGQDADLALRATDADAERLSFSPTSPSRGRLTSTRPVTCVGRTCRAMVEYEPNPGVCNATDGFSFVASDGTISSPPTPVSVEVSTPMRTTGLGLATGTSMVRFGQSVRLTARLRDHGQGATITFLRRVYGGKLGVIGSRTPGRDGSASVTVRMTARTTFRARSGGDNCFVPALAAPVGVSVRPRIPAALTHFRWKVGAYRVYAAHVPTYEATVVPSRPGHDVLFRWQRKVKGTWRPYLFQHIALNGQSHVVVFMRSGAVPGVSYRVRLAWPGGTGLAPTPTPWALFRVTK